MKMSYGYVTIIINYNSIFSFNLKRALLERSKGAKKRGIPI